ncbi:hypothetical protein BU16DRAFT_567095 [Lophium mytilinum]|uniref:Uncharacterized protein n=1 Tax=Lophium mytilinum TaxID=390894 RepID=A0A6A6QC27_9PEZI|nr:hypothetical protein BU16DRAFT_567095 [Lophium mytilinum]
MTADAYGKAAIHAMTASNYHRLAAKDRAECVVALEKAAEAFNKLWNNQSVFDRRHDKAGFHTHEAICREKRAHVRDLVDKTKEMETKWASNRDKWRDLSAAWYQELAK